MYQNCKTIDLRDTLMTEAILEKNKQTVDPNSASKLNISDFESQDQISRFRKQTIDKDDLLIIDPSKSNIFNGDSMIKIVDNSSKLGVYDSNNSALKHQSTRENHKSMNLTSKKQKKKIKGRSTKSSLQFS